MKSNLEENEAVSIPSVAAKISTSPGFIKSNPLLLNKGKVKQQDKKAFLDSFDDLLVEQKYKTNRTESLLNKKEIDIHSVKISSFKTDRKKSYLFQQRSAISISTKLKSQEKCNIKTEETKSVICGSKKCYCESNFRPAWSIEESKNPSKPIQLISGYDLSVKDISKNIMSPECSLKENCFVTVGDIQ